MAAEEMLTMRLDRGLLKFPGFFIQLKNSNCPGFCLHAKNFFIKVKSMGS